MAIRYQTSTRIIITLVLWLVFTRAGAQNYEPVSRGSRVEITFQSGKDDNIQRVRGVFGDVYGLIQFDPKHLQQASFDISLSAASIHSDKVHEARLKGVEFFNAASFPSIRIKSTSVTQDRPGSVVYILAAMLTIKGVTKPVRIQFTEMPMSTGYVFRGLLQFSRNAYGLGEGSDFDDNVSVFLQINAAKSK